MRRSPGGRLGMAGATLFGVLVVVSVAAPWLAPHDPTERTGRPFARPSADHLLGTNDVGQDLLSEVLFGARVSLAVGLGAAIAATTVGVAVGLTAGYRRGWVDAAAMRLIDIVLSLPFLPLMLVVGVFLGPGLGTQLLVIAAVMWAGTARELRSQVFAVRELDHVAAARSMGAPARYVLRRHILPAVAPLVAAQFVTAVKFAIVIEASLGFLGLGDPTARSWGTTLFYANARSAFLTDAWLWWVLPPGLCIAAAVLSFALMGYALEERTRPMLRRPAARVPVRTGVRSPDVTTPHATTADAVLVVDGLCIDYETDVGPQRAVDDVSLLIHPGEVLGLVGESGSGKSTLAAVVSGMIRRPASIAAGRVVLGGDDLAGLSPDALRRLRGERVALVPQQAMNSLNPVFRIGDQVAEAITVHRRVSRADARARAAELLELVGVDPARAGDHPHQLSGGMRQRVVIAIALANDPALLVADEPTTGLDVLVQAEILTLLAELRDRLGLAVLLVSHDLPVVLRLADHLVVMRRGRVVEAGRADVVAVRPAHSYTRQLLEATPHLPDVLDRVLT